MADLDEIDPQAPARPRGRRRSAAAAPAAEPAADAPVEADPPVEADVPAPRSRRRSAAAAPAEEPAADAPPPRSRRRSAAAAPAEPAADAPVEADAPIEANAPAPRSRRRSARVVAEPEEEEGNAPAPRRRGGLRGLRHANANANREREANVLIDPEEGKREEEGEEEGGEEGAEGGEGGEEGAEGGEGGGAMGIIAQMLQGTVNFLKTDPIEEKYGHDRDEEPVPSLKQLYDGVKENPDDQGVIDQATTRFSELKDEHREEGCDTDINIAMKQRCSGLKAGLYLGLYDIRKSVDESLKQMRPIQQPAVLRRIDRAVRPTENDNEDNVFVPADV